MSPEIQSHYASRAVAPLLSYCDMAFIVWVAAQPSNRVRVLEISPRRAITAAGIALNVSADKLRALPVVSASIVEARDELESSFVA